MRPVLVSDGDVGQSISTLSAVRALSAAGVEAHVAMSHPLAVAGRSRHCGKRIPVPTVQDTHAYADAIRELMSSGSYAALLLSSDAAILALGSSGKDLVDKAELARRTTLAGFDQARERTYTSGAELLASAGQVSYPVAIKSVQKKEYRSLSVWRADGPADLDRAEGYPDPLLVQDWIPGRMKGMSGVMWDGRLRAVLHQTYLRTWPRVCGAACSALTIPPDLDLERRVEQVLDGYEGVFNVQYIGNHLIDVNPRIYGSVAVSVRAGVNFPALAARLADGQDVVGDDPLRGRVGVPFRWVEGDLRSVLDARRSGVMGRRDLFDAVRPMRGTVHGDVWWSDPMPTAARLAFAARSRLGR